MQIDFAILFYDGRKYYHPKVSGIISGELGEIRGTDMFEAEKNFINYSKTSFIYNISGKTMRDLFNAISDRVGFIPEKVLSFYSDKSPFYIHISGELICIQNLTFDLQRFIEMYSVSDTLKTYFIFSCQAGGDVVDNIVHYSFSPEKTDKPQVCIDYIGEGNASFLINNGEVISINGWIPRAVIEKAKSKLMQNQNYLLGSWQRNLYGLVADLNYYLGGIDIIMFDETDSQINELHDGGEILGSIRLTGMNTENISMDALNYFLREFCNNYRKIEIIKRICILKQRGIMDSQFLLARRSANILAKRPESTNYEIPHKMLYSVENSKYYEANNNSYIILGGKDTSPSDFWEGISRRERPTVVLYENSKLIPLFDIFGRDAIKVTSLQYSSPVVIDAQGVIGGLIDVAFAGGRNQRDEETFINEQIGKTADNVSKIARAYQIVSDHKTPPGVKAYAENTLSHIQEQQGRINELLDIRINRIDATI